MKINNFFQKFLNSSPSNIFNNFTKETNFKSSKDKQQKYIPGLKLSYRCLDCDMFESYMALESWDSFPYLKTLTDSEGSMGYLLQDAKFMIFDSEHSNGLLKVICIYQIFGETLNILFFEVNKDFRGLGLGQAAVEILLLETGCRKIELDAKDKSAAAFWSTLGLTNSDTQHFYI